MRLTAEQFRQLPHNLRDVTPEQVAAVVNTRTLTKPLRSIQQVVEAQALVENETPGSMNKTEARYRDHLKWLHTQGEVAWYAFEAFKLRLADKTYYTPDFVVILRTGLTEFHEVKGHMEDDAAVKIKTAAEIYWPFRFRLVRWIDGGWQMKAVPRGTNRKL